MSRLLLDSGPVILHLRGHQRTVCLLRGLSIANRLAISTVTRLEDALAYYQQSGLLRKNCYRAFYATILTEILPTAPAI